MIGYTRIIYVDNFSFIINCKPNTEALKLLGLQEMKWKKTEDYFRFWFLKIQKIHVTGGSERRSIWSRKKGTTQQSRGHWQERRMWAGPPQSFRWCSNRDAISICQWRWIRKSFSPNRKQCRKLTCRIHCIYTQTHIDGCAIAKDGKWQPW